MWCSGCSLDISSVRHTGLWQQAPRISSCHRAACLSPRGGKRFLCLRHPFSCTWRRAISRLRACSSRFVCFGPCDLVHLLRQGDTLARSVFAFALCLSYCLGCSCMLSNCLRESPDTPNNRHIFLLGVSTRNCLAMGCCCCSSVDS